MAAPKGNQFWKARTKHGRDRLFASAELLWEACVEYFEWVDDNPIMIAESVKFQGEGSLMEVPHRRPMTISALCIFLDCSMREWQRWREVDDFCPVVTQVESIIYSQKFEGAAVEQFNANIIARDLGLRDAKDINHAFDPENSVIEVVILDNEESKI